MARRKPPEASRPPPGTSSKRAKRKAARAHAKVAAQRQDTARKWANSVVRDHDQIAVEDFRPKFLAKSTVARKAADAAIDTAKKATAFSRCSPRAADKVVLAVQPVFDVFLVLSACRVVL